MKSPTLDETTTENYCECQTNRPLLCTLFLTIDTDSKTSVTFLFGPLFASFPLTPGTWLFVTSRISHSFFQNLSHSIQISQSSEGRKFFLLGIPPAPIKCACVCVCVCVHYFSAKELWSVKCSAAYSKFLKISKIVSLVRRGSWETSHQSEDMEFLWLLK